MKKSDVDLSTVLGRDRWCPPIRLTSAVYNASGPRTGASSAMAKIAMSGSGGVLAKSATLESQKGNDMPRTWHDEDGGGGSRGGSGGGVASLNSEGLPNNGIEYYISPQTIRETMGEYDHSSSKGGRTKPYMVSISGKTLADNLNMLERISDALHDGTAHRIAAVELNLACPNIVGKPTIGYDFEQMEDVLREVSSLPCFDEGIRGALPFPLLGVKLPPYFDRSHFVTAASIINGYKRIIAYVATINTIGNALSVDHVAEMKSIAANGGYAGLSGPAVKYTALANVRLMRELLDESIDVVGVGGVRSGRDAFEMILCGARAVQVGTCHWIEGPGCFDRINDELRTIMAERGYATIDDFRGRLREWNKEGAATSREARMAEKRRRGGSGGGGGVATTSVGGGREAADTRSILIAVLFVVVAVLLAEKFGFVSL